jgi:rubrerythrin/uncharacterized membrane protein
MKKWQCQVCNYAHTSDEPPDICPVCNASQDSFTVLSHDGQVETVAETDAATSKKIQCKVCNYVHQGENFPEICPVCGAEHDSFAKVVGLSDTAPAEKIGDGSAKRRWCCEVCGYIHTGPAPPAKCPVCGADRSLFTLMPEEEVETPPEDNRSPHGKTEKYIPLSVTESSQAEPVLKSSPFSYIYPAITTRMAKYHAHPISVHIPNGVLPVAFLFFLLGIVLENDGLLLASFYNSVFVLISMPVILFSGYNDWKIRLGGHMTRTIRIKMICGGVVTILSCFLVIWRIVQPHVLEPWSSARHIYLLVFLIVLLAAAVAGFYGGKLIRFPGNDSLED